MSEPDWNDDDSWILDSLYGINRQGRTTYSNDDLDEIVDADPDDELGMESPTDPSDLDEIEDGDDRDLDDLDDGRHDDSFYDDDID
jgi:hypothetical protein